MSEFVLVKFCVAFLLLNFSLTKDIIVSRKFESKDDKDCGSMISPCRTLHYAIMNVSQNNDTILIDGGNNEKYIYTEQAIIIQTTNLSLVKLNESRFLPTIQNMHPNSVLMTCQIFCYLTIVSLDITTTKNTTVFQFDGTVSVSKSRIVSDGIILESQQNNDRAVVVNISSSYFNGFIFLQKRANVAIQAQDSSFDLKYNLAGIYVYSERDLNVKFQNCTFMHGHVGIEDDNSYNSSFQVSNISSCHFIECSLILGLKFPLYIHNTTFTGETINSIMWFVARPLLAMFKCINIHIENCTFSYAVHGACAIERSHRSSIDDSPITILNSTFINNTKMKGPLGGGAIYSASSDILITNCLFENNFASFGSSTIQDLGGDMSRFRIINTTFHSAVVPIDAIVSVRSNGYMENVTINATTPMVAKTTILSYYSLTDSIGIYPPIMVSCPLNHLLASYYTGSHNVTAITELVTSCIPCRIGTYSLYKSYQYASINKPLLRVHNTTCTTCPTGGICDGTIISRDNYWGYLRANNTLEFIECLPYYCCSKYTRNCTTYNTCTEHRQGDICGTCDDGYSENMLSTKCIDNSHCTWKASFLFWIVYVMFSTCFIILLMYTKEIINTIKSTNSVPNVHQNDLRENLLDKDHDDENNVPCVENNDLIERGGTDMFNQSSTISGLIKIIFQFYQMETLLRVNASTKNQLKFSSRFITNMMSSVFSITINTESGMVICPITGLNIIGKEFIKASVPLTCLVISVFMLFCNHVYKHYKQKEGIIISDEYTRDLSNSDVILPANVPFQVRLKCFIIQIMLLGYLTMSVFLYKSINCVSINDNYKLYMQGNIQCYKWWQVGMFLIIIIWSAPFFISLYASSSLLKSYRITPNQFLITLFFPPATIVYMIHMRNSERKRLKKSEAMIIKRFLLVLYEPFRIDENGDVIKWECVLIFRRLSVILANIFIIHPIGKLYFIFALLLVNLTHHMSVKAYKGNVLNMLETISLFLLCVLCSINMFWAGCYMTDFKSIPKFAIIGETFLLFELFVLMAPLILIGLYLLFSICKRCICICRQFIRRF